MVRCSQYKREGGRREMKLTLCYDYLTTPRWYHVSFTLNGQVAAFGRNWNVVGVRPTGDAGWVNQGGAIVTAA
jgi:hypothetical protein